jgi:AcrR family transcriptional regulator
MAETKEKIKNAAAQLFVEKGFARTSIGEIESAAGLAPRAGSFYRHFQSKEDLLVEIAKTKIAEQPEEFDFQQIAGLGNTRAELRLIAQIYEKASQRQQKYLPLIEEIRRTEFGKDLENKVNNKMVKALIGFVAKKPAAKTMTLKQKSVLTMMIFGAWLFYLTKSQQHIKIPSLPRNDFLDSWADFWAAHLDRRPKTKK